MNNTARLVLGTAQLGGNYGIANVEPDLSRERGCRFIRHALSLGVRYLDTAPGYGDSEAMIGDCLEQMQPPGRPGIITKLPSVRRQGLETKEARRSFITASIRASLDRLKCPALDTCLLHDPLDMSVNKGEVIQILQELKEQGLIRRIGVSVYDVQEAEYFLGLGGLDSIQLPVNVWDQRWTGSGLLDRLSGEGTEVFARSIYLQGLLLLEPEKLPRKLKPAAQPLNLLRRYSQEIGMSVKELCCLYVRDLPGVTGIVIGCETVEQLEENLGMMALPPLAGQIRQELSGCFADIPGQIIDPRRWNEPDDYHS